jgi:hypothetical protein
LKLEQFAMVEARGVFKIGKCGEHANAHDSCAIVKHHLSSRFSDLILMMHDVCGSTPARMESSC